MSEKEVHAKFTADTGKANSSIEELTEAVQQLSENMGNLSKSTRKSSVDLLSTLVTFNKTLSILKKVSNKTDDYVVSQRLLRTTFADTNGDLSKYIQNLNKMTGIDETALNRQVALFGQLGKSLSMTEQDASKLSKGLTDLTAKFSILYNYDFGTMATSVQRAIQGTQTTLKKMTGLEVTDIGKQATLSAYGIDRQVKSLNDAEQAIVTYATLLRQASSNNEMYEKTVNSVAWQKQMLTMNVKQLAVAFGQLLYPVLAKVLPVLNAILIVIQKLIRYIATLFNISSDVAQTTGNVASGFVDMGNGIAKASKEAKKSLRGFDMLNNISTPTTSGAGAGAGGLSIDSGILGILDQTDQLMLNIKSKAEAIAKSILEWLGFTEDENGNLKWSLDNVWNNIKKTVSFIVDKVKEWWKTTDKFKALTIGGAILGLIIFLNLLKGKSPVETLNSIVEAIEKIAVLVGIIVILGELIALITVIKESGMTVGDILLLIGGLLLELALGVTALGLAMKIMSGKELAFLVITLGSLAVVMGTVIGLIKTMDKAGLTIGDTLLLVGGLLGIIVGFMAALVIVAAAVSLVLAPFLVVVGSIVAILLVMAQTLPIILDALGKFIQTVAPVLINILSTCMYWVDKIISTIGGILIGLIKEITNLIRTVRKCNRRCVKCNY